MLVREAMTTPVTFIRSGVTLPAAAGVLLTTGVPAAPVLTDDGRLAGIVTELDLLRAMSEPDLRAHEIPVARRGDDVAVVDAVMTRDVVAVVPAMDVDDVVSLMAEEHFNAVPVMDGERLVGLMMRRDVLRLLTNAARSERPPEGQRPATRRDHRSWPAAALRAPPRSGFSRGRRSAQHRRSSTTPSASSVISTSRPSITTRL